MKNNTMAKMDYIKETQFLVITLFQENIEKTYYDDIESLTKHLNGSLEQLIESIEDLIPRYCDINKKNECIDILNSNDIDLKIKYLTSSGLSVIEYVIAVENNHIMLK
jgi:hypothetical protein